MPLAPRTQAAYRADWTDFVAWCARRRVRPLPSPPARVAAYLDEIATTRRVATVRRRLAAIRVAHLDAGVASPTDADVVRAAVSRAAWRSRHAVTTAMPIAVQDLRRISRAIPATTGGCRDRALILVGYGAALRPGELVALRASDVAVTRRGLRIETRRGTVLVPPGSAPELCAVRAWQEWAARVDLGSGPAFRSVDRHGRVGRVALGEHAVRRVVRRAAAAAGLDPTRFQGLSLRRGMVSAAAEAGVSRRVIMRQTGHRSDRLVRGYVRA